MSIRLMSIAWELDIPVTDKMVMLCLCDFANDHGECWPSASTIARKCSLTERSVRRIYNDLKARNLLHITERNGISSVFKVTPDTVSPLTLTTQPLTQCPPPPDTVSAKPSLNHQEPPIISPSGDEPLTASEIIEDWNDLAKACGLPTVAKLTDARKRRLQTRLRQYPELEAWQKAFSTIRASPFLKGENPRGWRADFDFLIQDKSFTKLVEGSYGQA